ncbi:MAG TPA: hypothetical protein DDX14_08320 [Cyanobacteria bacterium UBA9579]|nr:hypothetical protein [Cyanobacteria bacterium UBA9579]
MDKDKRTYSKTFEISFVITLAVIGILIALAIWSTGKRVDISETEFNKTINQLEQNQNEIKAELTALRNEMNNGFSTMNTNQQQVNQNLETFRNEINTKLDRINQRISNALARQSGSASSTE